MFSFDGQIPSGVGSEAGCAADLMLVVPEDLSLEEGVGVFVVSDFFVSQEAYESFLEGIETALDFAFGRGVRSDTMSSAQGGESTLKLRMGVQAVGGSAVTK